MNLRNAVALITGGSKGIGRSLADPESGPAHAQGRCVRDHVTGIGQQRQRAREQPAGDLDQHEGEDDDEGPGDKPLIGNAGGMAVPVVMTMAVMVPAVVAVAMIVPGTWRVGGMGVMIGHGGSGRGLIVMG